MTARVPLEQEQEIVKAYLAGTSAQDAAARFGYSKITGLAILKRYGIKRRTNSETHRRYRVDEGFFDSIDNEEKAYWLGFLTADGTIARGNRIVLGLQVRDKLHLQKFAAALESDHPVYMEEITLREKKHLTAKIRIDCVRLVEALQKLGVGERKSLTVVACDSIPTQLMRHYWRGLVDGDGSIINYDKLGQKWGVQLAGSFSIVSSFAAFVSNFAGSKAQVKPFGKIFTITYGGVSLPQQIVSILYDNSTVYLERKKALAEQVLATPRKKGANCPIYDLTEQRQLDQ